MGLREASSIAGLDDDLLRQCWHEGLISRRYRFHGMKLLPAFDTDELSEFAKAWKDCLSAATIARRWGLPSYAIEQLAHLGVITSSRLTIGESDLRFRSFEVAAFSSKMERQSDEVTGASLTLYALLQQVSGRIKPWGQMISAITAGELQAFVAGGGEPWCKRVYIEPYESQRRLMGALEQERTSKLRYSNYITQTDALEILNCSASSIKVLRQLTPRGANPKLFLLDDVLGLATQIMPTAEIAAWLNLDPASTFRVLQASRFKEIVPGGWDRAHAVRIITAAGSAQNRQLSACL